MTTKTAIQTAIAVREHGNGQPKRTVKLALHAMRTSHSREGRWSTAVGVQGARASGGRSGRVTLWFHVLAAGWIIAMLWLGSSNPQRYRTLLQEDRIVEWATVWLFFAAGVIHLRRAIPDRRVSDAALALFCLFVAGEEFSWGQRLLGYASPEFFLRNNFQQEVTVHNLLLHWSLQPGSVLMIALAAYGVLLPSVAYAATARPLMARIGATAPTLALLPWYGAGIVLLWWYPFRFTAEWVELLAGGLFLTSATPRARTFGATLVVAVVFGAAMTPLAGMLDGRRDQGRIACAAEELERLVEDAAVHGGGTTKLWGMRRVHKRIWSSINERYLDADRLRGFMAASCGGGGGTTPQLRRRHGVDPWGSPYWLLVEKDRYYGQRVTIYSFGPNRRRDLNTAPYEPSAALADRADGLQVSASGDAQRAAVDDIVATRLRLSRIDE